MFAMLNPLNHVKWSVTAAAVLAALAAGGGKIFDYGRVAVHRGAQAVEDRLPFAWKADLESERIAEMSLRRHALIVSRDNLARERTVLSQTREQREGDVNRIKATISQADLVAGDLIAKGENARVIGGKAVALADLQSHRRVLGGELVQANVAATAVSVQIEGLDKDLRPLESDIANLKAAEDERRAALAAAVRDETVLQARLSAAQARMEARGGSRSGDRAPTGAINRHLDELRVQLGAAEEKLAGGTVPPPVRPLALADIEAEAGRIGATGQTGVNPAAK